MSTTSPTPLSAIAPCLLATVLAVACGADPDPDPVTGPDAGAAIDADGCAAPPACQADPECPCDQVCSARRCVAPAACDEALLSWDGAYSNTDGTCLTDLAGYRLYWGTTPGGPYPNLVEVGLPCVDGDVVACGMPGEMTTQQVCSYRLTGLADGTTYFVMTTVNQAGLESAPTGEVSKTVACP